jgi:tetratricopeptide (TPR) repeat protein
MANKGKHQPKTPGSPAQRTLAELAELNQLDLELEFYSAILERAPDYVDVLRVMGNNLTLKGRIKEGLEVDRQLVRLRPKDSLAHYNLACSYAILKKRDAAIQTLRRAVELGYRDFRYMRQDRDLDAIRDDPRFRQILREFEQRA